VTASSQDRASRTERSPHRRRVSAFIPPQHGAWAFLALPLALGATVTPWTPMLALLAIAWVAAYPMSYAAFGLVRARRTRRFRTPFVVWTAIVLTTSAILVIWRPWLVWVGLVYAGLGLVNLIYARRNDERALANDAVFVAECAGMVAVTWAVGSGDRSWSPPGIDSVPDRVWILVVICALVLIGSTLHVKSLIRERRDPRFARLSRTVAVASVPVALALGAWWGWAEGLWLVAPFAVLAARAFLVPRRSPRPGAIGVIELGCFVLVVASAILASA
jgi:YwiC-like protein